MKKLFVILSVLIFTSCQDVDYLDEYSGDVHGSHAEIAPKAKSIASHVDIDIELKQYVRDWIRECKKHDVSYTGILELDAIVVNDNLDEDTHAITWHDEDLIEVKTHDATNWQKRFLIYHELGHYVFGLEHSEYDNVIMSWDMKYESWYDLTWEQMKDEYFESINSKSRCGCP